MAKLTFAKLREDLIAKNATWTAMETAVSKLPDLKRKALLGVELPAGFKMPAATASVSAGAPLAGLPTKVDWRNRNGNHVTAVKQQGGCGSCVSFCCVAVTESMASIEHGQLLDLSEADSHFCSSHGASCGGWWHDQCFDQIKSRGVCDEAYNPYTSAFSGNDIWNGTPSCKSGTDRNSRAVKITNIHTVSTVAAAKQYLANSGPLAAIMEVYTDFFNYSSGVYKKVSGVLEGLHCVQVIGYDDAAQCWICKNSWGANNFGEAGFFKIAYGQCKIDDYPKMGCTGVKLPKTKGWKGYESLGGKITSKPNAVSWGANRIDVVARGLDSAVHHRWWNGSAWLGWESLGGLIHGAPAISSWGTGRLDIFAVGTDYQLYHKWFQGGWSSWESLGGQLSSEPTAVSWGPNRIDIFARGTDSALWHMWWDGAWHGWESLGGVITSAPTVCSWASGRLDIFARGTDNKLWHRWFDGGWSNWENMGGELFDSPGAVSWGKNRIDIFYPGRSYRMMHRWWDGSNWSGEEDLGGKLSSGVGVSSWAANRLDCFVSGMDSAMHHKWYD